MQSKTIYYIAAMVGGFLGGLIPNLWGGGGMLSISSLIFSAIGGLIAIYLTWKFFNG